jgi:secreted PhoX family phosphatase
VGAGGPQSQGVSMRRVDRRGFLKGAAATTGGVLIGGSLPALVANAVGAAPPDRFGTVGPVADLRDGIVRLHLPPGFRYRSFHDTDGPAITLDDASRLTGRHDGMAAFPGPDGHVWLVRNHEHNGSALGGALGGDGLPYDSSALGGTTTALVSPTGEVAEAFTSLNGTQMNCAGGGMPWGSWITCEETINGPDVADDFTRNIPNPSPPDTYIQNARLTQPHGFVFEVPAGGQGDRTPIMHAGRFAHEAAAYSPVDGCVYLTEDDFGFASGFYRYVPPTDPMVAGRVEDGGRLEMLKVVGVTNAHLEGQQANGATYAVEWMEIEQPFPGSGNFGPVPDGAGGTRRIFNDEAIHFVSDQGLAQGAAHFSRLEGAKFTRGEVYFTSTQGGGPAETVVQDDVGGYGNGFGQVWSYDPTRATLTCRYQAPNADVLELPDNITAKSDRGTIVLCEDGASVPGQPNHLYTNYIRGLTRGTDLFDIAVNRLHRNGQPRTDATARYNEEFAGATFGPGTDTLFVNIQASAGVTFAIWGPWGRLGV